MSAKKPSSKSGKALKAFQTKRAQGRSDRKAAKASRTAKATTQASIEVITTKNGVRTGSGVITQTAAGSKNGSATTAKTAATGAGKPKRKQPVTVLLETDDLVKDQVNGFVTFIREHAIVGLAVGFVIGTQAQAVVKQLIASFIDPSFSLFLGGAKLSERTAIIHLGDNKGEFMWGAMAYALLNLLVVLATVYAIIKIFKLDKLDLPKPAAATDATKKTKKSAAKKKSAASKKSKLPVDQ